ncbi:MAG: hypothetical protein AB8F26_10935 [Phycisphaerales bacterium]
MPADPPFDEVLDQFESRFGFPIDPYGDTKLSRVHLNALLEFAMSLCDSASIADRDLRALVAFARQLERAITVCSESIVAIGD